MHITAEQMAAFRSHAPRNFALRMVDYIDANFAGMRSHSGDVLPARQQLLTLVHALVLRARSYDIQSEVGISQFVALALAYTRDFDELPGVADLLRNPDFTPEANIQHVLHIVVAAETRRLS